VKKWMDAEANEKKTDAEKNELNNTRNLIRSRYTPEKTDTTLCTLEPMQV